MAAGRDAIGKRRAEGRGERWGESFKVARMQRKIRGDRAGPRQETDTDSVEFETLKL